jgi:hypothetical protein
MTTAALRQRLAYKRAKLEEYKAAHPRAYKGQAKLAREVDFLAGLLAYMEPPEPEPVHAALDLLGLTLPTTADAVRAAYRRLARTAHPDRGGDAEEFKRLTAARDDVLRWLA